MERKRANWPMTAGGRERQAMPASRLGSRFSTLSPQPPVCLSVESLGRLPPHRLSFFSFDLYDGEGYVDIEY